MHIMTKHGWKPLPSPKTELVPFAPELYSGPLPSAECKAYIKRLEHEIEEWRNKRQAML